MKVQKYIRKTFLLSALVVMFLFLHSCRRELLSPERREELRLDLVETGEGRWDNFALEYYPDTYTVLVEIILNPRDLNDEIIEDIILAVRTARRKNVPEYRFNGRIKQFQWTKESTCCPQLVVVKEFR